MNKSELFKSREQRILAAALSTARSKGALDFRMADVAREAECSVGTLYGHFLSKEDMMAALVLTALDQRQQVMVEIGQLALTPMEQFVVLLMSERARWTKDEVLAQLEMLVGYTELWRRAADKRQLALRESMAMLTTALKTILVNAAEEQGVKLANVELLVERCRALVLGGQIYASRLTLAPAAQLQDDAALMIPLMTLLQQAGLSVPEGDWLSRCSEGLLVWADRMDAPVMTDTAA
ncbi:TetR/AcrR family transcriptional regulator [Ferrimonas gelatinilytica]|uniref:HTH tetR-type domain-containing protein n=1 Tax=Ferrimonas gelatinilytica TaxID=1255257 RepID=A0ABP9S817_9GAMM